MRVAYNNLNNLTQFIKECKYVFCLRILVQSTIFFIKLCNHILIDILDFLCMCHWTIESVLCESIVIPLLFSAIVNTLVNAYLWKIPGSFCGIILISSCRLTFRLILFIFIILARCDVRSVLLRLPCKYFLLYTSRNSNYFISHCFMKVWNFMLERISIDLLLL